MAATGCRKKSGFVTPLPAGAMAKNAQDPRAGTAMPLPADMTSGNPSSSLITPDTIAKDGGIPMNKGDRSSWTQDREMFKANMVHFAFDSSTVRSEDQSKVVAVADYLKANKSVAVLVEGHCDERGTEEYNRALGDRRAIAIREQLVTLGVDATQVDTITFGEDRPLVQGSGEDAWRQNRRGEFVLLTPPQ
jgi:peptidoglycan-associated lipoprotein